VPLEQLQAWYEGKNMDSKITTTLRQWVKRIVDQQLDQQKQMRNQVGSATSWHTRIEPDTPYLLASHPCP
jgi:hypothetical protein